MPWIGDTDPRKANVEHIICLPRSKIVGIFLTYSDVSSSRCIRGYHKSELTFIMIASAMEIHWPALQSDQAIQGPTTWTEILLSTSTNISVPSYRSDYGI
jgi:hypothetical protein